MAIDFPNSPTTGEIHTENGKQWQWDGEKWTAYGVSLNPGVLKVDSGNGRVGINQTTPTVALDVTGSARVTGDLTVSGTTVTIDSATVVVKDRFQFEGATADSYETVLLATDPTADRTITLPDSTGTVALSSDLATYAPLASPTLTGTPAAPTAAADTNTTQVATTAFVMTEVGDYLPLAGGTLSGAIVAADQVISAPVMKDYAETKAAMAAHDVDLTLGNVQTYTLSGNQTLTFSNPPASGTAGSFTLIVTNGASATLTWPTSVDWAGGTAPTLTASGIDILTFTTVDGGTIWYGFLAGADMK
jgi:hypothetical protein